MDTVTHHGRETAYRRTDFGSAAPAVLFVHGSGGDHTVWTAQYGRRENPYPAVALDLSGHGESDDVDVEAGPETLAAYAEDVVAVARETGAKVLVGNSLGGAVALTVALDHEFEPRGLGLLGTGAKLAVAEPLREWLETDFERAVEFLHGEDRLFHDADPTALERSRAVMRAVGRAVTCRDFLSCHTFDVRDRLDEVDVPALAVVGEHDRLTPPAYHEYLVEHLPQADLVTVPDAAHLAMVERPEAVARALESFVAEL